MDEPVEIVEVSVRDGLQSEARTVPTAQKLEMISRAVASGIRRIEVGSFVNPATVPQMADAEALFAARPAESSVAWSALILNRRGFDRAAAAGVSELNIVAVCSDTFGRCNQGNDVNGSLAVIEELTGLAAASGIKVSATLAVAFGCPYEGEVPRRRVAEVARRVAEAGVGEIVLADTIGVAVPTDVRECIAAVRDAAGQIPLRGHFHNTRNSGLANAVAAVESGVTTLDASIGGIGGCPFAPNASGNIPTEDLAYLLARMGRLTGLDLDALNAMARWMESDVLGHPVPGQLSKAGTFPAPRPATAR